MKITSLFDKAGSLGAIVSTMSCVACFSILASLSASPGLGFLTRFERLIREQIKIQYYDAITHT